MRPPSTTMSNFGRLQSCPEPTCLVVIPLVGGFHHQFVRGVNGSQQSAGQLSGGGSRKRRLMSALGHKRTSQQVRAMSALPPKADIRQRRLGCPFCANKGHAKKR